MTIPPADSAMRKPTQVVVLAITKEEHDLVVAHRGRSFTDEPVGHFSSTRQRPTAPDLDGQPAFGFHIPKAGAA